MGLAIARALTRRCGFELVSSELGGVPGTAPATVVETARPTAHSDPTYVEDGVIPYCVANVAVPRTPTHAITNVTLPFIARLAGMGVARRRRGSRASKRPQRRWRPRDARARRRGTRPALRAPDRSARTGNDVTSVLPRGQLIAVLLLPVIVAALLLLLA